MTEELKQIFRNDYIPKVSTPVQKDYKLTFTDDDESVIDNSHIVGDSLELYEVLCKAKYLDFGACESNELRITVFDVSEALDGREFKITMTVNSEEVELGYFTVISSKKQSDSWYRNLVCTDRMVKFDKDVSSWYEALEWPKTIAEIRASLCTECGVEEDTIPNLKNDSVSIEKTITAQNLTGRQMLRYLEQANGCFGTIGRNGKLQHIILNPTEGLYPKVTLFPVSSLYPNLDEMALYSIPNDAVRSYVESEEYNCDNITKVQIKTTTDDVGCIVGDGDNCLVIEGNILFLGKSDENLQEIATNILSYTAKRKYRPLKASLIGLPDIEIGNDIAVNTGDTTENTYVMCRTLKGTQVITDTIEANGTKVLSSIPTTRAEIVRLKQKSLEIIKSVDGLSVELTDLSEDTQTKFEQTAESITAEVTRATESEGTLSSRITQNAESITSEVSRATAAEGTLQSSITQTADSISAEVSRATAAEGTLQSQITQNANSISAKVSSSEAQAIAELAVEDGLSSFTVDADHIDLTGYTTVNEHFKIDENGNLRLSDGTASAQMMGGYLGINSGLDCRVSIYPTAITLRDEDTEVGDYLVSLGVANGTGLLNMAYGAITHCTSINGGTPITSSNISQYASSGATNTSQITADLKTSSTGYADMIEFAGASSGDDGATGNFVIRKIASSSDERIKKNIAEIKDISEKFMQLKPVSFDYIDNTTGTKGKHFGFIAQDVEKLFPADEYSIVSTDNVCLTETERQLCPDGRKEICYTNLHALEIAMIQQQQKQIDLLEARLKELEEKINGIYETNVG